VRIDGSASEVVLRSADGRVQRAATAEQLIAMHLNADVPVAQLRFWILGRPAPGQDVQELQVDSQGRLLRLLQAGWLVTYQQYEAHESGALPTRLRIKRERTAARFVLSDWRTGG
jgi:outer membrane lipoprotein LolB